MSSQEAANATIAKFGFPETLIADYPLWVVLLRPQQVTLGSLILACTEPATAFGAISQEAFDGLKTVTADIEACLKAAFAFEKINYLMLMMVDPHVHFHVLPRYDGAREFAGAAFADAGWPRAPDLAAVNEITDEQRAALIADLRERWPR
ncbi:MAG: HIT family protein [Alphaproteobacteria bacterium]|nr:HIT family protein [Alphaproteobacteria bacterium]